MLPVPLLQAVPFLLAARRARRVLRDASQPSSLRRARAHLIMSRAMVSHPEMEKVARRGALGVGEGEAALLMLLSIVALVGVVAGLSSLKDLNLAGAFAGLLAALPLLVFGWSLVARERWAPRAASLSGSDRPWQRGLPPPLLERARTSPHDFLCDLALALGDDGAVALLAELEARPDALKTPEGQERLGRIVESLSAPPPPARRGRS